MESDIEWMNSDNMWYVIPAFIVGILSFAGIWLYAMNEWGFLLGILFGWMPALIGGIIAGFLWPILVPFIAFVFFVTRT